MSIQVSPELANFVQDIITAGFYRDESEVVREALLLLQQREQLRKDLTAGVQELDRGLGVPGDEVFARLESKARELVGGARLPP